MGGGNPAAVLTVQDPELRARVDLAAQQAGVTRSEMVRRLLRAGLAATRTDRLRAAAADSLGWQH